MHHEHQLSLLAVRQLAVRRELGRQVRELIPGRRLHRRDRVVELLDRRQFAITNTCRVEQHWKRRDAKRVHRRHEERRLVLAVAETTHDHGVGRPRLVAAEAEGDRYVADVLCDPLLHGANGVVTGPRRRRRKYLLKLELGNGA